MPSETVIIILSLLQYYFNLFSKWNNQRIDCLTCLYTKNNQHFYYYYDYSHIFWNEISVESDWLTDWLIGLLRGMTFHQPQSCINTNTFFHVLPLLSSVPYFFLHYLWNYGRSIMWGFMQDLEAASVVKAFLKFFYEPCLTFKVSWL